MLSYELFESSRDVGKSCLDVKAREVMIDARIPSDRSVDLPTDNSLSVPEC